MRIFMKRIAPALGAVLLAAAPHARSAETATPPPRSVDQLKSFYQARCIGCHGPDGSAHDANGKSLKGADFTDARKMKSRTDAGMAKNIRKGIFFGLAMPAFKADLSPDEIAIVIQEIVRKATKGRAIAPDAPAPVK